MRLLPTGLLQAGALAGPQVPSHHSARLRFAPDDVGIGGILRRIEAVTARDGEPVGVGHRALLAGARPAPGSVVLSAGAHVVRHREVVAHVVELRDGQVGRVVEVPAAVPGLGHTAVVADEPVIGVARVDPDGVIVDVHVAGSRARRLAAVVREQERGGREVHAIGILRVDLDPRVVEGAGILVAHPTPGRAPVLGAVEAAQQAAGLGLLGRVTDGVAGRRQDRVVVAPERIGLDQRVHDPRLTAREGYGHAPLVGGGEASALHLGPRIAAVGAVPQARSGTARPEEVGATDALPCGREEVVRVRRIDLHVDEAGLCIDVLDAFPAVTAVGGLEQPTLALVVPGVAQLGNVHDVGVGGVDGDVPDHLPVLEAHQLPGRPAIGGLVDAVARLDGVAAVRVTRAHPHHGGVRLSDGDGADGRGGLLGEQGSERGAVVGRLPDGAAGGSDVERLGGKPDAGDGIDAAVEVGRSNGTPTESGEGRGVRGLAGRRDRSTEQEGSGEDGENPIATHGKA